MFSIDDRTGNVITTAALFALAAAVLYLARGVFLILLLSLFFAYLLEPAVTFAQHHSTLGRKTRTWAIAEVYLIGSLALGGAAYKFGPRLLQQIKTLVANLPAILEGLSTGTAKLGVVGDHVISADHQQQLQQLLARHHDFITGVFERGAAFVAYVAGSAIWLFAIPILAIFILQDGRQTLDAIIAAGKSHGNRTSMARIVQRVDTMLAAYIRAQLALAGLSFVFYTGSLLILGFPYAFALGILGGVLEFVPALGWIVSAAVFLIIGYQAHSHWIWMLGLLIVWRIVQNYVNSPSIMGDKLELKPLTVIVALMVGAQLGGIVGIFLSVPAVAALRIVWLEYFPLHRTSSEISDKTDVQRQRVSAVS
jgi:predicted PurR-regulated permease PerM